MSNEYKEKYVLDTNTLIGFSLWLPIDLNKKFWDKMSNSLGKGEWVLLDVVVDEIKAKNDGLKNWCKEQKAKGLVKKIDNDHKERAVKINNDYKMIDETTRRSTGDTFLLAYAEVNNLAVFSRESNRRSEEDLYKIPDVCDKLNIKYTRSPKMFLQFIGWKN